MRGRWMWLGWAWACRAPEPEREPPPSPPTWTAPAPVSPPAPVPRVEQTTVPSAVPPVITASPPPGLYVGLTEVTLSTDDGSDIWYTLDGSAPLPGGSARVDGPIPLDRSRLIRAVANNEWGLSGLTAPYLAVEPDLQGFSSDLPLIVAWTEDDAPDWKEEVYTTFSLSVFEPPAGGRALLPSVATVSTRAGMRVRGSSTAGYPKHPYRVETWATEADVDQDLPLLGMPSESDWVFGAPLDFDRALLRTSLAYLTSNRVGRYAPRTRFAELFVAERGEAVGLDDYVGVYEITERIERGADRVAITKLLPTDVAEPELSGGYLFKEDRLGPGEAGFTSGTAGGRLEFEQPFVWVDPDELVVAPEQSAYLTDRLDELGEVLVAPGFVHPVTGHHYQDLIDVDAWIDHHILNVWAKNPDAFRLSGFFHQDREGLLAAGPLWDFDRTMGCATDDRAEDPAGWDATDVTWDTTDVFDHGFWRGLFSDPVFRDRYWARWADLLANELSMPLVTADVEALAAQVDEAADRNFVAWSSYPPRGGSHRAEVDLLLAWLQARHDWIEGCLVAPDPGSCR